MKKIITLATTLLIAIFLLVPITANAAKANTAEAKGNETLRVGDTLSVTFTADGESILGLEGKFSYDTSKLQLISKETKVKGPWNVEFEGNKFLSYDNDLENPINTKTDLFTLNFKVLTETVGDTISVDFTNLIATDLSQDLPITDTKYETTLQKKLSTDANLKDLKISGGTLTPTFSPEIYNYTATVENSVENITVTPTADEFAEVEIKNPKLEVGENSITVTVKAEDGTSKAYTITVTRKPGSDNTLKSLDIGTPITPEFNPTTTDYTATVKNDITKITVTATAENSKSTITGDGTHNLKVGLNTIKITVKAEDGTEKIYTVKVTREEAPKSNNNNLSNLTIDGTTLTPKFDKNTTDYTATVKNDITKITVTATAENSKATITGDGTHNLKVGLNTIKITVKAEDGTEKIYTVKVTREEAPKSNNNNLSNLTIDGTTLTPTFDKTKTDYTATVKNGTTELKVTATAESDKATVTVTGNKNLKVGLNTLTVTVKAEDGAEKTYTVKVTVEEEILTPPDTTDPEDKPGEGEKPTKPDTKPETKPETTPDEKPETKPETAPMPNWAIAVTVIASAALLTLIIATIAIVIKKKH